MVRWNLLIPKLTSIAEYMVQEIIPVSSILIELKDISRIQVSKIRRVGLLPIVAEEVS